MKNLDNRRTEEAKYWLSLICTNPANFCEPANNYVERCWLSPVISPSSSAGGGRPYILACELSYWWFLILLEILMRSPQKQSHFTNFPLGQVTKQKFRQACQFDWNPTAKAKRVLMGDDAPRAILWYLQLTPLRRLTQKPWWENHHIPKDSTGPDWQWRFCPV